MGLLTTEVKNWVSLQKFTLKDVESFLKEKFGDKYEIKFAPKTAGMAKHLTGKTEDKLEIIKDAYHRRSLYLINVSANESESGKEEIFLGFAEMELKWWLRFLHRETGMIGQFIIGLIYGKAEDFYKGVEDAIEEKYEMKMRTTKIDPLGAFKKNK